MISVDILPLSPPKVRIDEITPTKDLAPVWEIPPVDPKALAVRASNTPQPACLTIRELCPTSQIIGIHDAKSSTSVWLEPADSHLSFTIEKKIQA